MPKACGGLGFEEYTETLFGEAFLPFRYWCIGLAELSAEEYLATKNPVAYGLAPLMDHGQLSKPRLKALCLNGIATSNITEVQAAILAYFVDTYLPLTQAEEEEFQKLIQQEEVQVMEFITSWQRKARAEGVAEGIAEGIAKGVLASRREILIRQLKVKFDAVPETTVQRIESISSTDELDRLLEKIIHVNSLAEMGLDGARE